MCKLQGSGHMCTLPSKCGSPLHVYRKDTLQNQSVEIRGLIQVGVNVTASTGTPGKKNRPSRPRGGPVQPVRLHWCTHWSNVTLLCFAYNID